MSQRKEPRLHACMGNLMEPGSRSCPPLSGWEKNPVDAGLGHTIGASDSVHTKEGCHKQGKPRQSWPDQSSRVTTSRNRSLTHLHMLSRGGQDKLCSDLERP